MLVYGECKIDSTSTIGPVAMIRDARGGRIAIHHCQDVAAILPKLN